MKKMTMLQVARKFQENAIKATEHPILDKILAKTKQKKNTIKGVKAWALIDSKNKITNIPEQLNWGDVDTIAIKRLKEDLIEYEQENEGFKVIQVIITPITKVGKKVGKK